MNRRISLAALALLPAVCGADVQYLNPWEGLRDYDQEPAFTNNDPETVRKLSSAVANARVAAKRCKVGDVEVQKNWFVPLTSNVCEPDKFNAMLKLVVTLAPDLRNNTSLELAALTSSGAPALIVKHYDIHHDPRVPAVGYPFLSLWRLRFTNGGYEAPHAGGFLNGSIHDIRFFGPDAQRKVLFVKHVSCIECEPTVYLSAIDFEDEAKAFEFTYSTSHDGFAPTIEYVLPGMGHTVDAKVETRTLSPSAKGPHLLQSFKMEQGETHPDEWWAFTCKAYRCDYQMYTNEPPPAFRPLWNKAKKL